MKNLITWILDSLARDPHKTFIINKGESHTYDGFYHDALKLGYYLKTGKILLKCSNKYYYALGFVSCLFTHNLVYLSNPDSHIYDNYSFDLVLDDKYIEEALKGEKELEQVNININELDPAAVILSSGTSLTPKPIVLSYKGIRRNIESGFEIIPTSSEWTFVSILPLDHAFGITSDFLDLLLMGATVVYAYSLLDFFTFLRKYEPTMISVPLTLIKAIRDMMANDGREVIGRNLKQVLVGGSKSETDLVNFFREYDVTICQSYGLTECSPSVSLSSREYYLEGSDGKILSCHDVSISEEGEIIVRGDSLMLNYLDEYEKGNIVSEVHTKDIGYVKDGYLFVTGRLDNLLIMDNGYKIQPETFEKELCEIKGIKECVIYLNNHQLYLDVVKTDELEIDLKKHLSYLDIKINFVDSLVKTSLGKINRGYYKNEEKK